MQKNIEIDEEEDGEEQQQFYNEIEKLQEQGINASDITKLKQAGYCTVISILMAMKKDLLNVKGISEAKLEKIQEAAMKIEKVGFQTGLQVQQRRQQILQITTGSKQLDVLLGGGIESMAITEVFGEFRTGKTQLCMTLCVTAQLPKSKGGGQGKVAYIDTESTFRPDRLRGIAERFNLDIDQVLENIIVSRAYTSEMMSQLLVQLASLMLEDSFSLLIVDSIMALYRVDYNGRGQLSERQQELEQFNVAVFITNQVMSDPGGGLSFMGDMKKPVGGNIIAHSSTTRLQLRKGKADQRICKIYDSPCLPEGECIFSISDQGITDALD